MKITKFQDDALVLINQLQELINSNLKHDGDTESTSQRIYLLNKLATFEYGINGTSSFDLQ